MNFEKYSKPQFDSRGLNTSAARKLADKLEDDVTEEIHAVVLAAFQSVVARLNAQGHNLKQYGEIYAGDISYRDEPIDGECFLRLGCDFVISAGYAHTTRVDEMDTGIARNYENQ